MAKTISNSKTQSISNPSQDSGKGFILAIAAILIVGLAAVAFFVTNRGEGAATAEAGEQVADVTVEGSGLDPMPSGVGLTDISTEPAFGKPHPHTDRNRFRRQRGGHRERRLAEGHLLPGPLVPPLSA